MMTMLKEMQAKMDSLTTELVNTKRNSPAPSGPSLGPDVNPVTGLGWKR